VGDLGRAVTDALTQNVATVVAYLPRLVVFLIVLLVGYLVARLVGRAIDLLLTRLGLDELAAQAGLTEDLARAGVRVRPARLAGRVVYVILLIATFVQAADALGLTPLSDALRRLLEFSPNVVLALAILLGGALLGELLARTAGAALARASVLYHATVATLIRVVVLVLALLMALQQLTIQATFVFEMLLLVLGATALAAAIAMGWGARTLAEHVAGGRYVEQNFGEGDAIVVHAEGLEAITGTIERLGLTSTTVRTPDGRRVVIPNGILARVVVQAEAAPTPSDGQENAAPAAGPDAPPAGSSAPGAPAAHAPGAPAADGA
jgi:small-conductance mechanosensitive channel